MKYLPLGLPSFEILHLSFVSMLLSQLFGLLSFYLLSICCNMYERIAAVSLHESHMLLM